MPETDCGFDETNQDRICRQDYEVDLLSQQIGKIDKAIMIRTELYPVTVIPEGPPKEFKLTLEALEKTRCLQLKFILQKNFQTLDCRNNSSKYTKPNWKFTFHLMKNYFHS